MLMNNILLDFGISKVKMIIDLFMFRKATICFLFILFGQLCPAHGVEGITLGMEQLGLLRISDRCHEFSEWLRGIYEKCMVLVM